MAERSFNPHAIARLRPLAYMKTVVMKYLDNLIAWADDLFEQDTIETLNEATQLYVLAAEILGQDGDELRAPEPDSLDYASLRGRLDEFANALVPLETLLSGDLPPAPGRIGEPSPSPILYFCIPANEKLRTYRDMIADRLFKIRQCMDIEGRARELPLFEPPIDPALLVRARAVGLDLRSALTQVGSLNLPHYRYAYLRQQALEFCDDVRSLGSALLAALEKKDAEELALIGSRHEIAVLTRASQIKDQQINEAQEALDALRSARRVVEERRDWYAEREYRNAAEQAQLDQLAEANLFEQIARGTRAAASNAFAIPDVTTDVPPWILWGGTHLGNAINAHAGVLEMIASENAYQASLSSLTGGSDRRQDEWHREARLSELELDQLDRQIAGAEIRLAIASNEASQHQQRLDQSREVEAFHRDKFTGYELRSWEASPLSALHFQAYRMARDLAKRAERAAQHELGLRPADFAHIGFEHFDSQRKGLLAGERLKQELRLMDAAYTEANRREHELTKHISLASLDPTQLIQLRETGRATFTVPELGFDLDFPGGFRRRIKSVSVTIPCVTGPYTNVSAKLTLEASWIRQSIDGTTAENYAYAPSGPDGDPRFLVDLTPQESIVTSTAREDNGLFELSFRDERRLPFEGAGAVSRWRLEFPGAFPQFDRTTIADAILHMNYVQQDGGDGFTQEVNRFVEDNVNRWLEEDGRARGFKLLFSLRSEFPSELHAFLFPPEGQTVHDNVIRIEEKHLSRLLRGRPLALEELHVAIKPGRGAEAEAFDGLAIQVGRGDAPAATHFTVADASVPHPAWGGLPVASVSGVGGSPMGEWTLRLDPTSWPDSLTREGRLDPDAIDRTPIVGPPDVSPLCWTRLVRMAAIPEEEEHASLVRTPVPSHGRRTSPLRSFRRRSGGRSRAVRRHGVPLGPPGPDRPWRAGGHVHGRVSRPESGQAPHRRAGVRA
ncbi:MAG: hypothetical protein M3O70_19375, partial [Actinomycetota bacterium]|nr:hypothetical protein [Actinomycetota bacterium]